MESGPWGEERSPTQGDTRMCQGRRMLGSPSVVLVTLGNPVSSLDGGSTRRPRAPFRQLPRGETLLRLCWCQGQVACLLRGLHPLTPASAGRGREEGHLEPFWGLCFLVHSQSSGLRTPSVAAGLLTGEGPPGKPSSGLEFSTQSRSCPSGW